MATIYEKIFVEPNWLGETKALCDGPSATRLDEFENFLNKVSAVDNLIKSF